MSIESRLDALEAEVFCVVRTTEYGHVMETGCDVRDELFDDWSDRERCPYCGKKLKGHDNVRPIE